MISHSLCGMVLDSPQSFVFDSFGPCRACAEMCLYSLTSSWWSPGSCLTRRKLLADIWAHGMEYTRCSTRVLLSVNILLINTGIYEHQSVYADEAKAAYK